jgi:hypothetical protein
MSGLSDAVLAQNAVEVERLLSAGAKADEKSGEQHPLEGIPGPQPLLIIATALGDARIVALLLEHGANPSVRTAYDVEAGSMYVGNAEFEQWRTIVGDSPMEYAARAGRLDLVQLFFQHGAWLTQRALDLAVANKRDEVAQWFRDRQPWSKGPATRPPPLAPSSSSAPPEPKLRCPSCLSERVTDDGVYEFHHYCCHACGSTELLQIMGEDPDRWAIG